MRPPKRFRVLLALVVFMTPSLSHNANAESKTDWNFSQLENGTLSLIVGQLAFSGWNYSVLPNKDHPNFTSVFPVCEGNNFNNCVLSLDSKKKSDQDWQKGTISFAETPNSPGAEHMLYGDGGMANVVGNIEEDAAKKIPTGRTSSIWSLPATPHKKGSQYLVSVSVDNFSLPDAMNPINFKASIIPILYNPGSKKWNGPLNSVLAYSEILDFPEETEFRISIKLGVTSTQISTFFNGRIKSPSIQLSKDILTISGSPEESPLAQTEVVKYSDLTIAERGVLPQSFNAKWFETHAFYPGLTNDSARPFVNFSIWEPRIRQIGVVKSWWLGSSSRISDCKISTFSGFISSNALLYSNRSPEWDTKGKTLGYQMASTHLDHDGNLNRGNLDLVIGERGCWGRRFT